MLIYQGCKLQKLRYVQKGKHSFWFTRMRKKYSTVFRGWNIWFRDKTLRCIFLSNCRYRLKMFYQTYVMGIRIMYINKIDFTWVLRQLLFYLYLTILTGNYKALYQQKENQDNHILWVLVFLLFNFRLIHGRRFM